MKIGIVNYPGSNCIEETKRYFEFNNNKCFYIWHKDSDLSLIENLDLLVLPGGFSFGDRLYENATHEYKMSPGTMAMNSPVTKLIFECAKRNIAILGICNGFQILTQLGLLSGKLELNDCGHFVCKKVTCNVVDNNITTEMYIANSYGKYVGDGNPFLTYENGSIAGIYNGTIYGMMPHPERNNYVFKKTLFELLLPHYKSTLWLKYDKVIKDLMFSEHISYKTSRKYLKELHTQAEHVIQGPGENAGIVDIGNGYAIAIRIESHNHPTFINPYEGAATGVGGILRDIFTMGARPIGIMDFLRFGTDNHSKNLLSEAMRGISYYGNCIGVPNIGGDCKVHESFNTNPLVNVCSLGIVKKENIIYGRATQIDQYLVYVGSKTGNEGINGAAMASNIFVDSNITDELKSNVQKCDPFLEKLLLEACCEISELKLVSGMQDMGAGGLLCASVEVIKRGREKNHHMNLGCEIDLSEVPIKHQMQPENILISESQERMLIVCDGRNLKQISDIFKKWDLEYAVIGHTNNTGNYSIVYEDEEVYSVPMDSFQDVHDYSNLPNECSKFAGKPQKYKDINLEIYDSTVGNRTIKGPDQKGSFSILDIPEVNSHLVLTWGESIYEAKCFMDKFQGVKPLCAVNCLNFGDPKYSLGDFKTCIQAMRIQCINYDIPIVGGNVSLYNTTGDQSIYPTPIIVLMGLL